MRVCVLYFAKIKEMIGNGQDFFEVDGNLEELLMSVKEKYQQLSSVVEGVLNKTGDTAIAVNQEIVKDHSYLLQDGDEVAFIPPISGG